MTEADRFDISFTSSLKETLHSNNANKQTKNANSAEKKSSAAIVDSDDSWIAALHEVTEYHNAASVSASEHHFAEDNSSVLKAEDMEELLSEPVHQAPFTHQSFTANSNNLEVEVNRLKQLQQMLKAELNETKEKKEYLRNEIIKFEEYKRQQLQQMKEQKPPISLTAAPAIVKKEKTNGDSFIPATQSIMHPQRIMVQSSMQSSEQQSKAEVFKLNSNSWNDLASHFSVVNLDDFIQERRYPNEKYERLFIDGTKLTIFANGTITEHLGDHHKIVKTFGGSTKEIFPNGDIHKWNATTQTRSIFEASSNTKTYQYPNGQVEIFYGDGSAEIRYFDGSVKKKYANGNSEIIFSDGTKQIYDKSLGKITTVYLNGIQDIENVNNGGKRQRIYPNGTVKSF